MDCLGFLVGEVTRTGRAVELPLPGQVVVDVEDRLLSHLLLRHQLILDLVDVLSPVGMAWHGVAWRGIE